MDKFPATLLSGQLLRKTHSHTHTHTHKGMKGDMGERGFNGTSGIPGEIGERGFNGTQGDKGGKERRGTLVHKVHMFWYREM